MKLVTQRPRPEDVLTCELDRVLTFLESAEYRQQTRDVKALQGLVNEALEALHTVNRWGLETRKEMGRLRRAAQAAGLDIG